MAPKPPSTVETVQPAGGARRPGDQSRPEAPQTAEQTCPDCDGTGRREDGACESCGGTGRIDQIVGDA